MKKALCLFLFVLSFVPSAFAGEAVADYGKVMRSIAGYSEAQKRYDEIVAQAKSTLDLQIKMSKSDTEKQDMINQYSQFCTEQKREIFDPLIGKMKYVLQQIAKEKGYTKVSAKAAGTDGVDITQEAIDRLNGVAVPLSVAGKTNYATKETEKNVLPHSADMTQKEKTAQLSAAQQPDGDSTTATVTEVQFSAGYDKDAICAVVARVAKNGINTAYVAEAKDKRGRTIWRARVKAESYSEAQKISAKLSRMGLKNFIVK